MLRALSWAGRDWRVAVVQGRFCTSIILRRLSTGTLHAASYQRLLGTSGGKSRRIFREDVRPLRWERGSRFDVRSHAGAF